MGRIRNKSDYHEKFKSFKKPELFKMMKPRQQNFIKTLAFTFYFTYQEFCQVLEFYCDLQQWGEMSLEDWFKLQHGDKVRIKRDFFIRLNQYRDDLRSAEKVYPQKVLFKMKKKRYHMIEKKSGKKIWGLCPVFSNKTLCCKLYTIDAVETCPLDCSYCIIQTFYTGNHVFDGNFSQKLAEITLDRNKFYHFGSGQSSDALIWSNSYGILDALFKFAADNPNILLELKTKSAKIDYLLKKKVPKNVVCSWSLNSDVIIKNEEHFTASLAQRIAAARRVANAGIKVGFHFHPMVYYKGWDIEYLEIADKLMSFFHHNEVIFISFGTVTLIKPVLQRIRKLGLPTKITQMEIVTDPLGKLTYPDHIKVKLYRTIYRAFSPWYQDVFIYLCMEKSSIWKDSFGYVYNNNDEFVEEYGVRTMFKLK